MTLLEMFVADPIGAVQERHNDVKRALATAQAVDEACVLRDLNAAVAHKFKRRADELLRGEK